MNRLFKIGVAVVVFAVVFALTWIIYFPVSPWGKQLENLKLAAKHRPLVEEKLRKLAGASGVKCGEFTGLDGSLSVSGEVPDEQTAKEVMAAVLATMPPVATVFILTVGGTNTIREIVRPNEPVK